MVYHILPDKASPYHNFNLIFIIAAQLQCKSSCIVYFCYKRITSIHLGSFRCWSPLKLQQSYYRITLAFKPTQIAGNQCIGLTLVVCLYHNYSITVWTRGAMEWKVPKAQQDWVFQFLSAQLKNKKERNQRISWKFAYMCKILN